MTISRALNGLERPSPRPAPEESLLFLILLLLLLSPWGALQAALQGQEDPLLQFTAAGHVLGFEPDGLYVANGGHMLHVGFVGTAGATPAAVDSGEQAGRAPALTRVRYSDLWPGIDLDYEAVSGGIGRSTWRLEAGADVSRIRLRYNLPVAIEQSGDLRIDYETGWLRESAPIAWQEIDGRRRPVEVAFRLLTSQGGDPVIGFEVGAHDPARTLLIDPTLVWNTFMGSAASDSGNGIARDASGNVYVTGYSEATWGSPVNPHTGGWDAFVAKLNSNGARIWNTFMGATGSDFGRDIAVDANGNVYVTGTGGDWGSPENPHAGDGDAFVAKLDSNGNLVWNTFMGSASGDRGGGIAVDDSDNVYVVGDSFETWGLPVDPYVGDQDAFVARLDSNGALAWNTFMGSASVDRVGGIAVDDSDNVYVTGSSSATWGVPVNAHGHDFDAFVAKLDSNGGRVWNTFVGEAGHDWGYGIAVDGSGNVYVSGTAHDCAFCNSQEVFAVKLDLSGSLVWETFMGPQGRTFGGAGIAVAASGDVYVTGQSDKTWESPGDPHPEDGGPYRTFAAKLNSSGSVAWNTFLGGYSGRGIAVDDSDNVYVVGDSFETWGLPVDPYVGDQDAFTAKIDYTFPQPPKTGLKGYSKNLQVLDGSKGTRMVLKSCLNETIFVKMPITGQLVSAKDDSGNLATHTEYDLEAGDRIEVTLSFPRGHTMDVYCHHYSAKITGLGYPAPEGDVAYVGVVGPDDQMNKYYLEEKLWRWLHPGQTGGESFSGVNTSDNAEVCIGEHDPGNNEGGWYTYAPNQQLPVFNAGNYTWRINLPKKPRGNINIQLQCGVLKPNAYSVLGMPIAIDTCAGETGEETFGLCDRVFTQPGKNHIKQTYLPTVNATAITSSGKTFPLTAYRVPSAFSNIYTNQ